MTATTPTPLPVTPPLGTTRSLVIAAAALVASVFVAYLPAIGRESGFVSDDFMILQRVRDLQGIAGAVTYFGQSYYEYYRPAGFLSFALDWSLWGDSARLSHAVSVVLHLINTVFVLVIARRLIGTRAAVVAAALFGLHIANHEAVYWFAARFDLLATAGTLAALVLIGRSPRSAALAGAALLYLTALLSKESAVTFPLVAGAYAVWIERGTTGRLLRVFVTLGIAAAVYLVLRQASGLPSAGGLSKLPKLLALGVCPAVLLAVSSPGAQRHVDWLRERSWIVCGIALAGLGSAVAWASTSIPGASSLRGLFTSAGFAAAHLLSPVAIDAWLSPVPPWLWLVGVLACAATIVAFRVVVGHATATFLAWFVFATLIPVSSMTEGTRYLYLPFVPVAMALGWAAQRAERQWRSEVRLLVAVVLAVGGWQVSAKGRDWAWASTMTREAVTTIAAGAAPCGDVDVILATAPARVRGVYCNINYEALGWRGSCAPKSLRTVVRLGVDDPDFAGGWSAPGQIMLRLGDYRGGFVTSRDLLSFTVPVPADRPTRLTNALGAFSAEPEGRGLIVMQRVTSDRDRRARWFVFSGGALRPLLGSGRIMNRSAR